MVMLERETELSKQHPMPDTPPFVRTNLPKKILTAMRRNRLRDGRPISDRPITLGRVGSLEIRLAQTEREIRKAQRLRYKVFYKEMAAKPDSHTKFTRRDADAFDAICDHLLVLDHDSPQKKFRRREPRIVGTYRLLRQEMADLYGGFYSASEFNIRHILDTHKDLRFLELGRSCVLKDYRTKRTIELLWQGIWAYVQIHKIDVMIGCASLKGTDPKAMAEPLTFLSKQAKAPEEWRVEAWPEIRVPLDQMPPEEINDKQALRLLPPLVKAYMRLGCHFGESAMVDYQFGTTDVFIILPVENIDPKYVLHYNTDCVKDAVAKHL
ncbi:ornithine-acyl[acyl carrier protein] N-acyltransferase [Cohaesibacter sp. ES.047]|uniref:GNAT family N-acetyltransferase n=1 Tax=Cohaesibacter sp. ES.047 TaxID=1798205 RepID=UPI000BBFEA83|nr:GNAT family N-acyltransferase [Cohaesibacter sp. ES.047]SNY90374.1 ornithine-acyl[acyl carrier protein] N-acyltransferase [Cohaesibacter sp. ES.047]